MVKTHLIICLHLYVLLNIHGSQTWMEDYYRKFGALENVFMDSTFFALAKSNAANTLNADENVKKSVEMAENAFFREREREK